MDDTRKKLPLVNKIAFALGTGGGNIFSTIASSFLLQYYTDTAMIAAGTVATMFLVCRIFDGISDLIMGGVIDRTHTKIGKARPWLIVSAPLMFLGLVLLMNVPMGMSEGAKTVYIYCTYIFMTVIVYTIYGIANTAMLPLMTKNPREHTMLATFSIVGNTLVGLVAGTVITPLVLNLGWRTSSIILGAIMCVFILISGLINHEVDADEKVVKETVPMKKQLPAALKNRYFYLLILIGATTTLISANASAAQIYYCNLVLKNPMAMSTLMVAGMLPMMLIVILMPVATRKITKRGLLILGSVMLIIGFALTGIAGSNFVLVVIGTAIRSFGAGPLAASTLILLPDVINYGYMKYGIRSEGIMSSSQSIGSKIGIGFGSALTGWILQAVHYNAAAEATEAVISAIRFDYTWLGAIISIAVLVLCLFLDVEKYEPEFLRMEAEESHPAG